MHYGQIVIKNMQCPYRIFEHQILQFQQTRIVLCYSTRLTMLPDLSGGL